MFAIRTYNLVTLFLSSPSHLTLFCIWFVIREMFISESRTRYINISICNAAYIYYFVILLVFFSLHFSLSMSHFFHVGKQRKKRLCYRDWISIWFCQSQKCKYCDRACASVAYLHQRNKQAKSSREIKKKKREKLHILYMMYTMRSKSTHTYYSVSSVFAVYWLFTATVIAHYVM